MVHIFTIMTLTSKNIVLEQKSKINENPNEIKNKKSVEIIKPNKPLIIQLDQKQLDSLKNSDSITIVIVPILSLIVALLAMIISVYQTWHSNRISNARLLLTKKLALENLEKEFTNEYIFIINDMKEGVEKGKITFTDFSVRYWTLQQRQYDAWMKEAISFDSYSNWLDKKRISHNKGLAIIFKNDSRKKITIRKTLNHMYRSKEFIGSSGKFLKFIESIFRCDSREEIERTMNDIKNEYLTNKKTKSLY